MRMANCGMRHGMRRSFVLLATCIGEEGLDIPQVGVFAFWGDRFDLGNKGCGLCSLWACAEGQACEASASAMHSPLLQVDLIICWDAS
jgi:hypothetical protein